jgi:mRNA interferase MazF
MSAFPREFPRRGEVYMVDFNPARGSEQSGRRPCVIVSNNISNQHSPVVVVAAMTRKIPEKRYPQDVLLEAGNPLPDAGRIMTNQLTTVDKSRLEQCRGELDPAQVHELNRALAMSLAVPQTVVTVR